MRNDRRNFSSTVIDDTILGEWFEPMMSALEKVRFSDNKFSTLPMAAFVLFGCLRQIQSISTLREQVQELFHLNAEHGTAPLARSTWSDALASPTRREILSAALMKLTRSAQHTLPDRMSHIEGLGSRAVIATDASYLTESSHYYPRYTAEGGDDNQKGHMMLSHYDLRAGIPLWASTETRSMGEMKVFKREVEDNPWLNVKGAIHVVDRAFIDGRFWEQRYQTCRSTVITRMKSIITYTIEAAREVEPSLANQGVRYDREVTLKTGTRRWRLIGFVSPDGTEYEYLTNELQLEPGVIAFLYHRRWDKEKYYDTFKNDLAGAKAWGKSPVSIEQQALMGIATVLLTRLFLQRRQQDLQLDSPDATQNRKHQIKQEQAACSNNSVPYRAFWTHLSKITKQVWRFLKNCFMQKHRLAFYQRQLKPLLLGYL